MLTKTSIISLLMLITFSLSDVKGFDDGGVKAWCDRIPSRLQSTNSTFRPFILNGTPADIEDYPFKVSLRIYGEFFCGGSVITSQWVLTAAHCLEQGFDPKLVSECWDNHKICDNIF